MILIEIDDPQQAEVRRLLEEHLADMFATSPADSVHALDHSALSEQGVTFWTARDGEQLLSCGALQQMDPFHAEVKSMRTTPAARGRGVAALLLERIVAESRNRGYRCLYLETGSHEFFAPARRLYARHGFTECPPFGPYVPDPHSVFMLLDLADNSQPQETRLA
ncbi:GNAT family N-acetyltransferase [Arthrobacter glacialis]|uniref:GNAT family N-acetyltransferase n=1 Tax=Arthrobacter glacialis TaxID=1664 RepID=A0A2S3ZXL2_ARTGL|nr:GNAT family N-acetyltransferase [Arthrobacter glacialis]POH58795.1 GNAT family N-acetyltransferase [Arthrobacter glacialis]POH73682.1 GNAT family N-acetyltransferase [Arthrobacter glacialis]